jgi:hypothetical protein
MNFTAVAFADGTEKGGRVKPLTNRQNLPETFVRAAEAFRFESKKRERSISVTGLLGPPRIRILADQHRDEIEEDAVDRKWAVIGSAVHQLLERADPWKEDERNALEAARRCVREGNEKDAKGWWDQAFAHLLIAENHRDSYVERFVEMERHGWSIRGVVDHLADGIVSDWKIKGVFSYIFGIKDGFPDIEQQLNLYAHALRDEGEKVKGVQAVMIFRDWSPRDESGEYPREIEVVPMRLWTHNECEEFIAERLALHEAAEKDLPECTNEERWAKPDKWAVMPRGSRAKKPRALRVLDSREDAARWAFEKYGSDANWKTVVEYRPGESTRCKGQYIRGVGWRSYCPAFPFCDQGQRLVNKEG